VTGQELVIVRVRDLINAALAAHEGCTYESPPQPRDQALMLVRVLLGYTGQPLNGSDRWTCPVAGGRRTVTLVPTQSSPDERLRQP
jgi:hypothetical protein